MKIEWHKVTWYSWAVAAAVFGLVFADGLYVGSLYEKTTRDVESLADIPTAHRLTKPHATDDVAGRYRGVGIEADLDVVRVGGDVYRVTGFATWHGAGGMVNTGDVDGEVTMTDGRATYRDGDCEMSLTFGAGRLVAEDNLKCGGLNVTFSGEYARQ
jgi:hypothetical protein